MKKTLFFSLFGILLAACSAATPSPNAVPTSEIDLAPTQTPTHLPQPTATSTLSPTSTPTPSPTETQVPTPTQSNIKRGVIAFVIAQNGWGGIYVIQADGKSDYLMLSDHPTIDSRPSWSPDGSQIAFESRRDDPFEGSHMAIYMMDSDGSHFTRLTDADAWYSQADWSPVGDRIVITSAASQDSGDADLAVLDLKTKKLTRLTEGPALDMEPSWSPDASQIAFASDRDGTMNIFKLALDTGEITQLTQGTGENVHPDWSPDGTKILFVSNRDGNEEIYVMDADGANQVRLTTSPGRDVDPEWSPDGYYFVFGHEENRVRKIYVSDLSGTSPELLFDIPDQATSGHPAWTIAQEAISEEPVLGPPFCARDTDGDYQPDTLSTTFSTEDDMAFVLFPYDNMQNGLFFTTSWDTPADGISFSGDAMSFWDGGETGVHTSYTSLQHALGVVTIKLSLDDKLMQEIECEVVEP